MATPPHLSVLASAKNYFDPCNDTVNATLGFLKISEKAPVPYPSRGWKCSFLKMIESPGYGVEIWNGYRNEGTIEGNRKAFIAAIADPHVRLIECHGSKQFSSDFLLSPSVDLKKVCQKKIVVFIGGAMHPVAAYIRSAAEKRKKELSDADAFAEKIYVSNHNFLASVNEILKYPDDSKIPFRPWNTGTTSPCWKGSGYIGHFPTTSGNGPIPQQVTFDSGPPLPAGASKSNDDDDDDDDDNGGDDGDVPRWEFQEGPIFKRYLPEDSAAIEAAFQAGKDSLVVTNRFGSYDIGGLQPGSTPSQTSKKTNFSRVIRRVPPRPTTASGDASVSKASASKSSESDDDKGTPRWEFQEGPMFKRYLPEDSAAIEAAFQAGKDSLVVTNRFGSYDIGGLQPGSTPSQTSKKTNFSRAIRRVPPRPATASSGTSSGTVVNTNVSKTPHWEFQEENIWKPCLPGDATNLERAFNTGKDELTLTNQFGVFSISSIRSSPSQKSQKTGFVRSLRRVMK